MIRRRFLLQSSQASLRLRGIHLNSDAFCLDALNDAVNHLLDLRLIQRSWFTSHLKRSLREEPILKSKLIRTPRVSVCDASVAIRQRKPFIRYELPKPNLASPEHRDFLASRNREFDHTVWPL